MTLCIGGLVRQEMGDRIVLCFDTKISCDEFGSESEYKFFALSPELCCLVAGKMGAAKELVSYYRAYLTENQLAEATLVEQLQEPISRFKRRIANGYTGRKWGFSYDVFLHSGKTYFGEDYFNQQVEAIAGHTTGVELIIAGFVGKKDAAVLCTVRNDKIELDTTASFIGTGAYTAEPALHARAHARNTEFKIGVYNIFEAKKIGENSPFVGRETRLLVISPGPDECGIRYICLTGDGMNHLEALFDRYGPKSISALPEFPDGSFIPAIALPSNK